MDGQLAYYTLTAPVVRAPPGTRRTAEVLQRPHRLCSSIPSSSSLSSLPTTALPPSSTDPNQLHGAAHPTRPLSVTRAHVIVMEMLR
jgi:hypothetical protein